MTDLILMSAAVNLLYSVGAFVLLVLALRALDKLAGFNFREWLHNADDPSKALYFGTRIIAGSIIVGLVVSVPI